MADLIAFVLFVDRFSSPPPGQYRIAGVAEVDGAPPNTDIGWETFVPFSAAVLPINTACINAAVAAANAAGFTVGPSDNKRLFASAVLG
jgi:hypothetical protein